MKWWEKTVEYKFIALCLEKNLLKLAPLDGNEERAGDTIISQDNNWVLIEFKKDEDSIKSEEKKFDNYLQAKIALLLEDHHHFLIYGFQENSMLKLEAKTYFSGNHQNKISVMLNSGKPLKEFKEYLKKFLTFKKTVKGSDGSGGGLNIEDYSLVASVNSEGSIIECKSLTEFASQEMNQNLQQENNNTRTQTFRGPTR